MHAARTDTYSNTPLGSDTRIYSNANDDSYADISSDCNANAYTIIYLYMGF